MCRIAGLINYQLPLESAAGLVKEMCGIMQAGGPDDHGLYVDAPSQLVLGHRRLSIIDLSGNGHQPMHYEYQRYWISYNGELYNYRELKQELTQLGCSFANATDTEVILAAFAKWGTESFKRFNGMFAFALWDSEFSQLYLVRDGAGIKPLYYATTPEGLSFASEMRAFAPVPWLQNGHPHWQVYLMAYGHLPEPITTLRDVKPLEKGTWLQYDAKTRTCATFSFVRYSYIEKIRDRRDAIAQVRASLQQAVERNLLADAPLGVFLSGGLDSSIIALLANAATKEGQLNTISLYFEQEQFSEKKFQELLQERLHCNHHQHLLKEEEFHQHLPTIIDTMDLPSSDGINTWFISKFARECNIKAVLSGVGADELFGGYPSFERVRAARILAKLPNKVLKAGNVGMLKQFRRLVYLTIPGPVGLYLFLRGQFTPTEIAENLGLAEEEVWRLLAAEPKLPEVSHLSSPNLASWMEFNLYMQNQLLRDNDVMSMAHGLEIRVPFLDDDFTRLSMKISSGIKYGGRLRKQLLIDAFKDMLPEPIWNRPKMGFAFPFREWLSRNDYARGYANKGAHGYYEKFVAGEMHWSQYLTAMLIQKQQHG